MTDLSAPRRSGPTERTREIDWSLYVQYFCRHCAEECINRLDEDCTRTKECRDCFDDDSLSVLNLVTHHLPDEMQPGPDTAASYSERLAEAAPQLVDDD